MLFPDCRNRQIHTAFNFVQFYARTESFTGWNPFAEVHFPLERTKNENKKQSWHAYVHRQDFSSQ